LFLTVVVVVIVVVTVVVVVFLSLPVIAIKRKSAKFGSAKICTVSDVDVATSTPSVYIPVRVSCPVPLCVSSCLSSRLSAIATYFDAEWLWANTKWQAICTCMCLHTHRHLVTHTHTHTHVLRLRLTWCPRHALWRRRITGTDCSRKMFRENHAIWI